MVKKHATQILYFRERKHTQIQKKSKVEIDMHDTDFRYVIDHIILIVLEVRETLD